MDSCWKRSTAIGVIGLYVRVYARTATEELLLGQRDDGQGVKYDRYKQCADGRAEGVWLTLGPVAVVLLDGGSRTDAAYVQRVP
jgi:hypothetical protein